MQVSNSAAPGDDCGLAATGSGLGLAGANGSDFWAGSWIPNHSQPTGSGSGRDSR